MSGAGVKAAAATRAAAEGPAEEARSVCGDTLRCERAAQRNTNASGLPIGSRPENMLAPLLRLAAHAAPNTTR
eukprot:1183095-Prorocentrum_minimum.AAC.2